ncbi:hypothetical protein [Pseudochrobactrum asaccharolyticum]|uniref:hypothetical protein n=1 Tax=Pseudochrobactrum asaccharolyticum TaxID=354351 RepID=UPI0040426F55
MTTTITQLHAFVRCEVAMIFVTNEIQDEITRERRQAHSLRIYLYRRANGLKTLEYSSNGQEIEKARALASAQPFRAVRQKGADWDEVLGLDTSIKNDNFLTAYFELCTPDATDPESAYVWQRLLKECGRNKIKALRKWRTAGAEALYRASTQRAAPMSGIEVSKSKVKDKYAKKGTGTRPFKAPIRPSAIPPRGRVKEA